MSGTGDTFTVTDGKPVDLPTPEPVKEPEVTPAPVAKEPELVTPTEPEPVEPTEPVEVDGEPTDPTEPAEGDPPKHKQTASERVRQAVNEKNAEKEARIRAEERAATLQAIIEGKAPVQTQAAPDKPRMEQFETLEDYEAAHEEWLISEAEKRVEAKFLAREAEKTNTTRLTEASTKFKDFNTVAGVDSPLATYMQKNPAMASAAWNDTNYAAVSYHLGKNLDEAARISALPPLQAVIEIGKLSERLTRQADVKPPIKVVTGAPDPVKTLNGGGEVETDESNLSMAEYGKKWLDKKAKGR